MRALFHPHPAALLGVMLGVAGCDIVGFVQDPLPRFEQTWNVPAESTTISVARLLPPSVSIYSTPGVTPEDSVAFRVDIGPSSFSRRLGDDCGPCQTIDGLTVIKPAFALAIGGTQGLPTDIVSGSLLAGTVTLEITNGLSFDPLRVRSTPGAQGHLVIVIRSGSLVIGTDSIDGATTAFPSGATLTRAITLSPGPIRTDMAIELTLDSPAGDQLVSFDADGTMAVTASVPNLLLSDIRIDVANRSLSSTSTDSIKLEGIDASIQDNVQSATLFMTITNPFNVTGDLTASFRYGAGAPPSDVITKTFALPSGPAQTTSVGLTRAEMLALFGRIVELSLTGTVTGNGPIDVTPKQAIRSENRLQLKILTGRGS